jgi:hypothetical protein
VGEQKIRTVEVEFTLTFEELSTWGVCPACEAPHGEMCSSAAGFCLGQTVGGGRPKDGVHLARLRQAPDRVHLVPVDGYGVELCRLRENLKRLNGKHAEALESLRRHYAGRKGE